MAERIPLKTAVHLFLIKGNQVLLSRRYKTGWMDGKYSLMAGHLNSDESLEDGMVREAFEEAGIVVKKEDLEFVTVIHRREIKRETFEYLDFFFTTKVWEGEPKIMEEDKCDKMAWFPLNKLPKNLLVYVKVALENYKNKKYFSEVGWE